MTCKDRTANETFQPCNDKCRSGCVCKIGHIRPQGPTDLCIIYC